MSMSNIKAPKLHQSTAFPCPTLMRISGAMYSKRHIIAKEEESKTDGSTESVGLLVSFDRLLAKTKVRELHVSTSIEKNILRLQVSINNTLDMVAKKERRRKPVCGDVRERRRFLTNRKPRCPP